MTETVRAFDARMSIRDITVGELAALGLTHLAYIRPVMMDGAPAFAIHGADGTPMAVAPDHALAVEAIEQHDLLQVAVH